MTALDRDAYRLVPLQRWFEDFTIGERFPLPSRTLTEAHFLAFQAASGDNHPVHYDREYCRAHGMPDLLAHGYQVLIQTVAGAGLFPHMVEDSLRGFIEQSSRFLHPVYAGGHALRDAGGGRTDAGPHHRRHRAGDRRAEPARGGRAGRAAALFAPPPAGVDAGSGGPLGSAGCPPSQNRRSVSPSPGSVPSARRSPNILSPASPACSSPHWECATPTLPARACRTVSS